MDEQHDLLNSLCLHELFEAQVQIQPERVALLCDASTLTYLQLEQKANQLAHLLRQRGLGKGDLVGILLERSPDLYITLLAILKIGAAYVPLDPMYPPDRIQTIAQDCQMRLLVTHSAIAKPMAALLGRIVLLLDQEDAVLQTQPVTQPNHSPATPDDLCYVIYTSGSTGTPKGVEITHRSVCNYVQAAQQIYAIQSHDRVYQGFSLAFDASIEEIWPAFATGATLITTSSQTVHFGAGLSEFLKTQQVSIFSCVPTLLAMLETDIPSLRLLILGGEACPHDLIVRWSRPDLRILNTYGPTEATVVATYAECYPDKPITIGKPLPNYQVFVLNENLQAVNDGEVGELFIGGVGVARGYINRPELMQKKFLTVAGLQAKRVYRTGDLVKRTAEGELQFMGRVDTQIKLRGFRIELAEIENIILRFPGIKSAAVQPQEMIAGAQSLVGYVVLEAETQFNQDKLIQFLHDSLPEYMVPNLFEVLQVMPCLSSGKLDRVSLPKPHMHQEASINMYVAPRNDLEKKIASIWEELFKHKPISIQADFFHDLGGHSLLAAKIVSVMRKHPEFSHLSMADLYANNSIEKLARKIELTEIISPEYGKTSPTEMLHHEKHKAKWRYALCGFAQLIGCYVQFALESWEFLLFYLTLTYILTVSPALSLHFLGSLFLILLLLYPALFLIAIAAKWLLLGKIKPGEYRLWGWFYFRWWLAEQICSIAPITALVGSPLMNWYYRLLGAKIGSNCYIGTETVQSFDLLSVGNNSSINADATLLGYTIENGWLKIGPITIGNNCFVGANSILARDTTLGDGAKLDDHSMLPVGAIIPARESFLGSPARPGVINHLDTPATSKKMSRLQSILLGSKYYIGIWIIILVYAVALMPGIILLDHFFQVYGVFEALLLTPIAGLSFVLLFALIIVLIKRLCFSSLQPGQYKLDSFIYLRKWLVDRLMDASLDAVGTLYATLFTPSWFRLLGAKVGKRTEISTASHISPDLLTIEDETFIADGAFLGAPRINNGYVTILPNKIGKRAFVGNSALLPIGTELGESCLIGCLSVPPSDNAAAKPNTSWFGSPAIFLPKRETFLGFSEEQTYIPTKKLFFQRLVFDFVRVIMPATILFVVLALQFFIVTWLDDHFSLLHTILLFPLFDIAIIFGIAGLVIISKWIFMGRYKPDVQPAWSLFVWKNELVTALYDAVMSPMLLEGLSGTPFMSFFMRLLGAKIGKRVFFDTTFFTEFDLIDIGNDVALNSGCTIQTHLFEDRVMKMDKLQIHDDCSVGSGAVVLYDTVMEQGSSLADLSLLMKGETLPMYSRWFGIPARLVTQN
jgi:non-ribosomal peptide synthetase-like protein